VRDKTRGKTSEPWGSTLCVATIVALLAGFGDAVASFRALAWLIAVVACVTENCLRFLSHGVGLPGQLLVRALAALIHLRVGQVRVV
jgi:hypothetical protein